MKVSNVTCEWYIGRCTADLGDFLAAFGKHVLVFAKVVKHEFSSSKFQIGTKFMGWEIIRVLYL